MFSIKSTKCLKGAPSGLTQFLVTEIPLKMRKDAFNFIFRALFVPKISKLCLEFPVMSKDGLIRKIRLMLTFMTSQSGKQTILIYILHNISRSKDNQTIAFHQLIKYNMRKNFYDKSYITCRLQLIQTQIINYFQTIF